MQFSSDSEFFLKFLIDEFETFIKKETRNEQKSKDKHELIGQLNQELTALM